MVAGSDIEVERLVLERAASGALRRDHRVLRHLEPSGDVERQGLGRDQQRAREVAGRPSPSRRRAARTRRRPCTRGSRTAGRFRATRPRRDTSRSRTRTAWRRATLPVLMQRFTGEEVSIPCLRRTSRSVRSAVLVASASSSGLRPAKGIVELGQHQRVDPLRVRRPLDPLRELGLDVLDQVVAHAREPAQVAVVRERDLAPLEAERVEVRIGRPPPRRSCDAADVGDQAGRLELVRRGCAGCGRSPAAASPGR